MKSTSLDRFGELLVKSFRDKAIEQNEMLLNGQLKGKAVQLLQARVGELSSAQKDVVRDVVKDLLDVALHDFLFALQDAHDRKLGIEVIVDGENVAELSEMLNGEVLGPDGWVERFSSHL
jgi:hypothetical protein